MSPLIALATHSRSRQLRVTDREAGESTLEIAVIALGLFLAAGLVVVTFTAVTTGRIL